MKLPVKIRAKHFDRKFELLFQCFYTCYVRIPFIVVIACVIIALLEKGN